MASSRERAGSSVSSSANVTPPPLPLHLQGKTITVESIFYEQQTMALGTPCLVQDTARGVSSVAGMCACGGAS